MNEFLSAMSLLARFLVYLSPLLCTLNRAGEQGFFSQFLESLSIVS